MFILATENFFTEELVGILWTEFKLFISNWSRFDLDFPLQSQKNGLFFFFFFWVKANFSQNLALKLAPNENYFTGELISFLSESKSQSKFGIEVSFQWKLLHWGTGRCLMNWIQVVYFKLKEIWPVFAPAKAKKPSLFFTSLPLNLWMKAWKL